MNGSQCRLDVCGWKLADVELEEQVWSWIHKGPANMLCISRQLIMFKFKFIYDEKYVNNEVIKDAFIGKNGWLVKIKSCNNLLLRMKITIRSAKRSISSYW